MFTITLPWFPEAVHPNFRSRMHWAKTRATKQARAAAAAFTRSKEYTAGEKPTKGPLRVTTTFHPRRLGHDLDNCQAACKAYYDGIADALKINDREFRHQAPVLGSKSKLGQIIVTLELDEDQETSG